MTASELLSAGSIVLPLVLAAALWLPPLRAAALRCAAFAALPAVVLAIFSDPSVGVGSEGLLLGLRLGAVGPTGRTFLLFTSSLWLVAGLYAHSYLAHDERRARFATFFLLTLAGNLGVVLATDLVSFYGLYALMTYAAYGLVVHEGSAAANRAGRVYLVMALMGEMLLLTAFLLIVRADVNVDLAEVPARVAASPVRGLLVGMLLVGFGVKAGGLFLHLWLPLAHPVAPTPASAVLSGAMIKAGLLGWLRFLPLGSASLPEAGTICLLFGFAAAFYGVAIGLTKREPKIILAYSSVSQMGFMTAAVGIGLANAAAAAAVVSAISFYALHHALAKGALFLGAGVAGRTRGGWPAWLVGLGLVLPALDLAGAPLSSGALAKSSLKTVAGEAPWGTTWLPSVLSAAAVASTVLMALFLLRALPRGGARAAPAAGLWLPWVLLLALDVVFLVSPPVATEELGLLLDRAHLWDAAWPVGLGVGIAAAGRWLAPRLAGRQPTTPTRDVLSVVEGLLGDVVRASSTALNAIPTALLSSWRAQLGRAHELGERLWLVAARAERSLATFDTIGLLFVCLGLAATIVLLSAG